MAIREGAVAGIAARVCRVSFSGELAYEVNVDGRRGLELWEAIHGAGEITPYGTETMHVLRAEKGYPIIGQETDGTVTPQDLGHGVDRLEDEARLRRQAVVRAAPPRRAPIGSSSSACCPTRALLARASSSSRSRRRARCSAT